MQWYGGGPEIEVFLTKDSPEFCVLFLEAAKYEEFMENTEKWVGCYIPLQMSVHRLKQHLCRKFALAPEHTILHQLEISAHGETSVRTLEHFDNEELGHTGLPEGSRVLLEEERRRDTVSNSKSK